MRRLLCAVVLFAAGCGGAAREALPPPPGSPEQVVACETMLKEFGEFDPKEHTEAEITAMMQRADGERAGCAAAMARQATTPVEALFARHRAGQFELHALSLERHLAETFDGGANRCTIVKDTFAVFFRQLAEVETGLQQESLTAREQAQLTELRELDLKSIDLLFAHAQDQCKDLTR